jgi:hypothetical protein
MALDNKNKRRVENYSKFLNLYPQSYRRRFAEPMLQTFTDMLHDHLKSSDPTWKFVTKIYLDTAKEIIIENSKEVAMNIKTQKSKVLIGSSLSVLLIASIVGVVVYNNRNSKFIPLYSTVEEGRSLSKGKKDKCLPDNQQAVDAINKDDIVEEFESEGQKIEFSSFGTTVVAGFYDIPAGTNGEVTKNSYDGKIASGSIVYERDYGSYNYTAEKLPGDGRWGLVTLVACEM